MNRTILMAATLFATTATAAPVQLTHQGRLLDALGAPVDGQHEITITISSDAAAQQTTHVESIETDVQDGYYTVVIGSNGLLEPSDLPNPGWITVSVGETPMGTTALGALAAGASGVASVNGSSASSAARSCKQLFEQGVSTSGLYWLDPDGSVGTVPYQAYCDMTTAGGGWTLVHSKQAAGFYPIGISFNPACASQRVGDCASYIHPAMTWSDALYRFEDTDVYAVVVRGWSQSTKDAFSGASYRSSPATPGVQRWLSGVPDPPVTIDLTIATAAEKGYVSEQYAGTDQHINLWAAYADNTNNYTSLAPGTVIGQQCIAGYCRTQTAWMLVR